MSDPKVTVLLAVRNGAPYLREAIDSVLGQSFRDFELLVVDDASDDGTAELLAGIADERVRVLTNERNLGQVPSLNLGLEQARGEYVARLDHDDACLPDRLARQVAVLEAEPAVALVGSWATLVDEDGHVLGTARQSIRDYVDFVYWNLVGWVLIPHPSAVFRRDVVRELGGYDASLGPSEDKDLWRKLALARHEARIVEAELIRYRLHTTQLSRVHEARQQAHDAQSHRAFLEALAGSETIDPERLRLLLRADSRFFGPDGDGSGALRDLEAVLHGARTRLGLNGDEQRRLERLVRARVAHTALIGWNGDLRAWWRDGPRLAAYGARRGGRVAAAEAFLFALELPTAPALAAGARSLRSAAGVAFRLPALGRFEARARRSTLARRLYAWLAGRS